MHAISKAICIAYRMLLVMRSLHDMHEMNAFWAGQVCLSVHMIQLEHRWTELDEIWYGRYATGDDPKVVFSILYNR
jgi:hypothetical protein